MTIEIQSQAHSDISAGVTNPHGCTAKGGQISEEPYVADQEKCHSDCVQDLKCKAAYLKENKEDKNKSLCFRTEKHSYERVLHDPGYDLLFHRNSAQYCNQDRISCIMSGESHETCTDSMTTCLITGPGKIFNPDIASN